MVDENSHPWGWTPARRARQAKLIHTWTPWTRSTGAVTEAGKRASPRNRAMPGTIKYELLMMRAELEQVLQQLKQVAARRR